MTSTKAYVNLEDKVSVTRAVSQWTLKLARQSGVNGVYILLLVKSPFPSSSRSRQRDTQRRAFTLRDRDTLVSTMLARTP